VKYKRKAKYLADCKRVSGSGKRRAVPRVSVIAVSRFEHIDSHVDMVPARGRIECHHRVLTVQVFHLRKRLTS